MAGKKLYHFNCSYLNDCDDNQLNGFLSETNSLIAKAIDINKLDGGKGKQIVPDAVLNNLDLDNNKLNDLRLKFADQISAYIANALNEDADFFSLVEQSIMVPEDNNNEYNHAKYHFKDAEGTTLKNNPIVDEYEKYGIARRIRNINDKRNASLLLKNVCIPQQSKTSKKNETPEKNETSKKNETPEEKKTSEENETSEKNETPKYLIVFDNVVNPDVPNGEGIGMIFKQSLAPNLLSWKAKDIPNKRTTLFTGDDNDDINYYSLDLGDEFSKTNQNFKKITTIKIDNVPYVTGTAADKGRPLIMSIGYDDDNVNIFISFHGFNMVNIRDISTFNEIDEDNKNLINEMIKAEKELKEIKDDQELVSENEKKLNKLKDNLNKLKDNLKPNLQLASEFSAPTDAEIKDFMAKLLNTFEHTIKTALQDKTGILLKEDGERKQINLFMGGDANDPNGVLLEVLKKEGINVKFGDDSPANFKITFNKLEFNTQDDSLNTCCANCNSIKSWNPPNPCDGSSDINNARKEHIIEKKDMFPPKFYQAKNFKYKGDYAIYGSTNEVDQYVMQKDESDDEIYLKIDDSTRMNGENEILVSDHLPVKLIIKEVEKPAPKEGGKRRTRRRRRSTRRKRRMSRRRRRSTRRKR